VTDGQTDRRPDDGKDARSILLSLVKTVCTVSGVPSFVSVKTLSVQTVEIEIKAKFWLIRDESQLPFTTRQWHEVLTFLLTYVKAVEAKRKSMSLLVLERLQKVSADQHRHVTSHVTTNNTNHWLLRPKSLKSTATSKSSSKKSKPQSLLNAGKHAAASSSSSSAEFTSHQEGLWKPISDIRSVNCHVKSHIVTYHSTQVNAFRLKPCS